MSLPEGLREIGTQAFYECQSLTEISIPDTVESIGKDAFYCTSDAVCAIVDGRCVMHKGGLHCIQISEKTMKALGESYVRTELIGRTMMLSYLMGEFIPKNQTLEKLLASAINLKKNKEVCVDQIIESDDASAMDKLLGILKKITLDDIDAIVAQCNEKRKTQVLAVVLQFKKATFSAEQVERAEDDRICRDLGLREKTLAEWRKEFTIKLADGTAVVSKYKGSDEIVYIPANVGGHPVVALGEKAFTHCETVKTVYISDGIQELRWKAFWGCPNVKDIFVPESVDTIEDQAIQGKKRQIHGVAGSCAEQYAKENNIPFVAE